jgi:hypothetical protein
MGQGRAAPYRIPLPPSTEERSSDSYAPPASSVLSSQRTGVHTLWSPQSAGLVSAGSHMTGPETN